MRNNLFVILKHVQHFHNHFPLKTKDNKLCFCYAGFVQKYENKQKKMTARLKWVTIFED